MDVEPLILVERAAELLGVTPDEVRQFVRNGGLPHYRFGDAGRFRFLESDVRAFMENAFSPDAYVSGLISRIEALEAENAALRARLPHRSAIDFQLRQRVFQRDQNRCRYCEKRLNRITRVIDHVIPWSRVRRHDEENLVTACRSCNHRKWNRTPAEAGMILLPPASSSL